METVISVENISKKYVIGHQRQNKFLTLRDTLTNSINSMGRRIRNPFDTSATNSARHQPTTEEFWAVKDVSFKVKSGDRIGIIGRNGAGKSTLLKLLSRITEPSTGRIVIDGRVASLLEVGTGFHPELTGRENIFLNGAILGMTKPEIKNKFEEIVAFSEVEKFLDTPVKRYSSGMYVRLAFSIAAHLEPEILIVDEVLAVGDAQFQKKCLGKMKDAGREGRTVLFVSHNMGTIRNLCSRCIMLDQGKLIADSDVNSVVGQYLSFNRDFGEGAEISWDDTEAPSCEELALQGIRVLGPGKRIFSIYDATKPIDVEIRLRMKTLVRGARVNLSLLTSEGITAFSSTNHSIMGEKELPPGLYTTTCRIPANLLNDTTYIINVHIGIPGVKVLLHGRDYMEFTVEGSGGHGSSFSEKWPGIVAPKLDWVLNECHEA